jgi:hypothetical protein
MDPQAVQAEIERYMAQSQQTSQAQQQPAQRRVMTPSQNIARDVGRLRDTIGRGDGEFQENFDYQQGQSEPQAARERPAGDTRQRRQGRPAVVEPQPEPQGYRQPTMAASELNNPAMRSAMRNQDPVPEDAQRRGPSRRNAEVSIREALPRTSAAEDEFQENFNWQGDPASSPDEQPTANRQPGIRLDQVSDQRLEAERLAAESGGVRELATDVAEGVTGAIRSVGTGLTDRIGRGLSIMGATGAGGRMMEQADGLRDLGDQRVEDERLREETRAARVAELDAEIARRQGNQPTAPASANAQPEQAPSQPVAALPSVQNPNEGQRTNVSMPRGLSIQDAREQGMPNTAPYSLGDGRSIRPGPVPKKAMTNAVRSGMENLMANADQIIMARLRVGDIKGATAFREFIRSEQAQKGMEYMNRTFAAVQYQDNTTFAASTAKMVEAYDPDGDWSVDTERTRLTQDTEGNPSGAILALRNKNTGEVSEQTYQGLAQVYDGLARYGDPQGQFTAAQERIQQAQVQKVENAKGFTTAYDAAAELLFPDGFIDGTTGKAFTPEERQQADTAVREYIASSRPDLPQPPPRQAPVTPPPAAASGVGSSIRSFFGGTGGDKPIPTMAGM